jgi:xylose isomerase
MDIAADLGVDRVSTCPLNDGHDYPFEMDYQSAYDHLHNSLRAVCTHNPGIRVCIEYKKNDARTRNMIASAGEVIALCQAVGADNLGATLDFGHSLLAGERPAQAAVLLSQAKRLFYVHLNDNDRFGDWDLIPGIYNIMEFIEFFYFLKQVNYDDDWYAYDVMSKEMDSETTFSTVAKTTRRLESYAQSISGKKMAEFLKNRKPVESLNYIYDHIFMGKEE